jgi:hypothetical protein
VRVWPLLIADAASLFLCGVLQVEDVCEVLWCYRHVWPTLFNLYACYVGGTVDLTSLNLNAWTQLFHDAGFIDKGKGSSLTTADADVLFSEVNAASGRIASEAKGQQQELKLQRSSQRQSMVDGVKRESAAGGSGSSHAVAAACAPRRQTLPAPQSTSSADGLLANDDSRERARLISQTSWSAAIEHHLEVSELTDNNTSSRCAGPTSTERSKPSRWRPWPWPVLTGTRVSGAR